VDLITSRVSTPSSNQALLKSCFEEEQRSLPPSWPSRCCAGAGVRAFSSVAALGRHSAEPLGAACPGAHGVLHHVPRRRRGGGLRHLGVYLAEILVNQHLKAICLRLSLNSSSASIIPPHPSSRLLIRRDSTSFASGHTMATFTSLRTKALHSPHILSRLPISSSCLSPDPVGNVLFRFPVGIPCRRLSGYVREEVSRSLASLE